MRILITGAAGFVGPFLCRRLLQDGHAVRAAIRRTEDRGRIPSGCEAVVVPELGAAEGHGRLLSGIDAVAHLAARVHDVTYRSMGDLEGYVAANTTLTEALARAAAAAGANAFVFASSIKVNGESTAPGRPFTSADEPRPQDAYALSKWRAEQALQRIARDSRMHAVSVRPPLVYGPGVGGNFLRLMQLVARGFPLPFGAVDNRRSLIYVENLADLIARCLRGCEVATVLASDGAPVSTRQLVAQLAAALGTRARLIAFPGWALRAAGRVSGRSAEIERLLGSLEIDTTEAQAKLGWRPPYSQALALEKTAAWFLEQRGRAGLAA